VLEHGRTKKLLVYKKKRRKGYERKNTHRQGFSILEIEKITTKKPVTKKTSTKSETKAKTPAKKTAKKVITTKTNEEK
jgi:large subunit ribosomal protein L21